MAKRKISIGITYMLTIFIALVLVGGTGYYILTQYVLKEEDTPVDVVEENPLYVPSEGLEQTLLLVLDNKNASKEEIFVLARFLPIEKELICVPISGKMLAQVNTTNTTVGEFYYTGGVISAIDAIQNATGVSIEKYMVFDNSSFSTLCEILGGGVTCNVPYNIQYLDETTGEQTFLSEGRQLLDGNQLRKYLTYPELQGGEDMRVKLTATMVTDLLNQGQSDTLATNLDNSFKKIVNSVDTNITSLDFDYRKDAIKYTNVEPTTTPAKFKIPSGEWQEDCSLSWIVFSKRKH